MRGGHKQNAGRKQGTSSKNAEEAIRLISEMVIKEIKPIREALILKAKNGDVTAIKELFDRAFGRSLQSVDVTSVELPRPIMDFDDESPIVYNT